MASDEIEALIERLEKATWPDRELDAHIHQARWPQLRDMHFDASGWLVGGDRPNPINPPHYTSSIDSALTLVPADRCSLRLAAYDNGVFGAHAWLLGPSKPWMSNTVVHGEGHVKPASGGSYKRAHDLYPLAICIASLRARATQEK